MVINFPRFIQMVEEEGVTVADMCLLFSFEVFNNYEKNLNREDRH